MEVTFIKILFSEEKYEFFPYVKNELDWADDFLVHFHFTIKNVRMKWIRYLVIYL